MSNLPLFNPSLSHPIKSGIYQHYKGRYYQVLGTALHSETREILVLYKPLYAYPEQREFQYFVRPLEMFEEEVEINGIKRPRFQYIRPTPDPQKTILIDDNVYGLQEIDDPVVIEIINTPQMQRLKGVNQYGTYDLLNPKWFSSRFDHCVGVYLLLRHLGTPRAEQIAGLLHDIAHTAFSHVIDYAFDDQVGQTVHETFHKKVIFSSEIPQILKKYGFDVNYIIDEHNFPLLEQPSPDLCGDRVDYTLRDSLCKELCSREDVSKIFSYIKKSHNQIVLTNKEAALLMAEKSIDLCENFYSSYIQAGSFQFMGNLIKEALQKGVINQEDIFLTDREVIVKLKQDHFFGEQLEKMNLNRILPATSQDYTYYAFNKVRFVNPMVLIEEKLFRTTDLFPQLQDKINGLKEKCKNGYYVKII
ncbi:DUF1653 domain-containing protein [Candidatus Woesearchaeota archaeon]|nr:DUF1653 domain-containing protein [Candidatus Woesearchaeota archaeon]